MLISTAMMLLLCRSGVCLGFNQQLYRRLALSRLAIKPNEYSSSALSLSTSSNNINNDCHNISQLYGKTLISIQDCISAYANEQQYQQKSQDATNNNKTPPPKVVFIDASWYHRPDPITNQLRSPSQEYINGPRLPHARYIDIDAVATTYELFPQRNPNNLPHMFPPPQLFGMVMDAYNIHNDDHIIIYARRGAVFTPRVWFLFVGMGHDENRVHLMQGSLEDYMENCGGVVEEYSLSDENDKSEKEMYYTEKYSKYFEDGILNVARLYNDLHASSSTSTPRYNVAVSKAKHICGKEEVLDAINSNLSNSSSSNEDSCDNDTIILDTRGSAYAKGHMPSAIHLPYAELVDPSNTLILKSTSALKQMFEERNIDYLNPNKKIILSCGSGVSVCHGYLAMKQLGRDMTEENTRIYDGSWTEWKDDPTLPKVTTS
ncbi:hypothetical protein ACHAWC_004806 [Mediolabrus comicus]